MRPSNHYWQIRYQRGGTSGVGSYGKFAVFKAKVINAFIVENDVTSIIDFGCGDGNLLRHLELPQYSGYEVSDVALKICQERFKSDDKKHFYPLNAYSGEIADLALSLDVIYHLLEDTTFHEYMTRLFLAASHFVIIYSSNTEELKDKAPHVNHRKFSEWIEANISNFKLIETIINKYPYDGDYRETSFCDFFIYEKL